MRGRLCVYAWLRVCACVPYWCLGRIGAPGRFRQVWSYFFTTSDTPVQVSAAETPVRCHQRRSHFGPFPLTPALTLGQLRPFGLSFGLFPRFSDPSRCSRPAPPSARAPRTPPSPPSVPRPNKLPWQVFPHDFSNDNVMSGFGYGLPISRLYARYFGGDLQVPQASRRRRHPSIISVVAAAQPCAMQHGNNQLCILQPHHASMRAADVARSAARGCNRRSGVGNAGGQICARTGPHIFARTGPHIFAGTAGL